MTARVLTFARECDCCGERKPDVREDGCGAHQCTACLLADEAEARAETESWIDEERTDV